VARILWKDAQGKEGAIDLDRGQALIGRAMDCRIRTDDAMVSRNHARIYWQGGQFFLEDLGSANGVYYQEQRVTRHALKHGDAVRCGSLWLRFVDNSPQQAAPPQQPGYGAPPQAGGPPPPMGGAPQAAPPMQAPPPQAPPPQAPPAQAPPAQQAPAGGGRSSEDHEEIKRLRRRIEQLKTELRLARGNSDTARRLEELSEEVEQLKQERNALDEQAKELNARLESESASARGQRGDAIRAKTTETVGQLNDLLSNLRINITAAEGEFEQFANAIPRASFELIREALRSSSGDMQTARELLRKLREIAS
jgi:predicted component of type VI protein secretion system